MSAASKELRQALSHRAARPQILARAQLAPRVGAAGQVADPLLTGAP